MRARARNIRRCSITLTNKILKLVYKKRLSVRMNHAHELTYINYCQIDYLIDE